MNTLSASFIVHNDFSHIYTALESLYSSTIISPDVYVTINAASSSLEVEKLQSKFPQIKTLLNKEPQGFAANHNRILEIASTPFIALINDDVYLQPGTLDYLISVLEQHSDIGLVGPLIRNPDGTMQLSTFSDPTLLRAIYKISGMGHLTQHGGIVRRFLQSVGIAQKLGVESLNPDLVQRDVPVVVGVCMVTRKEVYQQVGGMDEDTLVYGEEYGWHWRIHQAGWRVTFAPEAVVTHYNVVQSLQGWKLAEHRKSILNYFLRYKPFWQAVVIRFSIVWFHSSWAIVNWPFNRQQSRQHWLAARVGFWHPSI